MNTQNVSKWLMPALALTVVLQGCNLQDLANSVDNNGTGQNGKQGQGGQQQGGQQQGGQQQGGRGAQQGPQQPPPKGPPGVDLNAAFTGKALHLTIEDNKDYRVVDKYGNAKYATPKPFEDGDKLIETTDKITALDRAYAHVFMQISPLRDVLAYEPYSVSRSEWMDLTSSLRDYDDYLDPNSVKVLDCAQAHSVEGVRLFLMQAEMALKCRAFADTGEKIDMSAPDGHDFCRDVLGINL